MSKAEERALEAYPVFMTTLIPADDEHPLIEQDCNKFTRKAYLKGYHQAEKDLEITREELLDEVCEWLMLNADDYIVDGVEEHSSAMRHDFIDDFRKAMRK